MAMPSETSMTLAEFRDQFPALRDWVWLDTPGAPPAATAVVHALQSCLGAWSKGEFDWTDWDQAADRTRSQFAALIGADDADVAVMTSLAEAAATVAHNLPAGQLVMRSSEFRSNLFPWISLAASGFDVVQVEGNESESLIEAITEDTVLVAVSEVLSSDGNRADIPAIVARCQATGARLFVNLTQSLGVLRFSLADTPADFVAVHGYKWLLAPRGCCWLYAHPRRAAAMQPLAPGWKSVADPYAQYFGGPMRLPPSARRLDTSGAWFSFIGAEAALNLIAALNANELESRALELARELRERLVMPGITAVPVSRSSHIVAFDTENSVELAHRLARERVKATVRHGRVRFGFHGFNDQADVDRVVRALTGKGPETR